MQLLHQILFKLKCLFALRRKESELSEELNGHLELQIEANIKAGMTPDAARQSALRELGGIERAKESYRDEYTFHWLESLLRDLRHGLRGLMKRPGFTGIALFTLALGIGASTAVFSVVETVLLRPLPFPRAEALVNVEFKLTDSATGNLGCSVPELDDLRTLSHVFADVSMVFPMDGNLTGVSTPQRVEALAVSPNYFRLLGVSPSLGRTFGSEEESVSGWAQGCVLSHDAWLNYFGGDPSVIGRTFYMDYDTFRVIGVMPRGFRHPGRVLSSDVDVWFTGGLRTPPFTPTPQRDYRIIPGVIGRLAPGVTPTVAQTMIERYATQTRSAFPRDYAGKEHWGPVVRELQTTLTGDVRPILWILFSAVVLVLLICCLTLANLILVRGMSRRQEMAMRCALGASRAAIVRQLVVESLLIAVAGGAGGLLIAWGLSPLLLAFAPVSIPILNQVALNGHVLAFVMVSSCATCVIFGLVPALRTSRFELIPELKTGGRSAGSSPDTQHARTVLVMAQVALSLVLLICAGLLFRSFINVWQTKPGFNPHHVLSGRIWLPPPSSDARRVYLEHDNRVKLMRELVRRFSELPGVEAAAIGNDIPLTESGSGEQITIGGPDDASRIESVATASTVTPDYFRTLEIPLVRGRIFSDADDGRNPVAIVNQALASRYWPGADPIGHRLARGTGKELRWCTIVGVVANTKSEGLDKPDSPRIYVPAYQDSWLMLAFFVRTNADANAALIKNVCNEIHGADADLPAYNLTPMDTIMARSLARRQFVALVIGSFAVVSLLLTALGIYGVVALSVSSRRKEIGVRIALGATRRQITTMILRYGLVVSAAGFAVGTSGAYAASRALRSLLYETQPQDPLIWISITSLLFGITAVACWIPARRASSVDPMVALRAD